MGKFWEAMTESEQKAICLLLNQQNFVKDKADIDYQCYYDKVSKFKFWQRNLWDKFPEAGHLVTNMFLPAELQETIVDEPKETKGRELRWY
jgi:hypothetical protein